MRAVRAIARVVVKELIRKKDLYVLVMLMLTLLGFLFYQDFFGIEDISRYIKDMGYSLVTFFSFIIAVTFAARQIPREMEARTIYPLLAKPVTRYEVILGKFAGGAVVSTSAFSLFYGIFVFFCSIAGGPIDTVLLVQGYIMGLFFLVLVTALVIFFSSFLTISANVTLTFLLYIMIMGSSGQLRNMALFSEGAASFLYGTLYYLMPHFEFFDLRVRIAHSWDPLPGWVVVAVSLYTVIYCWGLLYLSAAIFKRKKF
jgi:Cu-processing system permease protein